MLLEQAVIFCCVTESHRILGKQMNQVTAVVGEELWGKMLSTGNLSEGCQRCKRRNGVASAGGLA